MQGLLPYLFVFAGIMGTLLSLFWTTTNDRLRRTGVKAEGIIFDLGRKSGFSLDTEAGLNIKDKVQIRFVTEKQEWITGYIKQDFAFFFTGQYKMGQKVDVYYNPSNPTDYYVATGQSELFARVTLGFLSLVSLGYGLLQLV